MIWRWFNTTCIHSKFLTGMLVVLLHGIVPVISHAQTAPPFTWVDDVASPDAEMIRDVAVDTNSGHVVSVGIFNGDISAWYGFRFAGANGGGFVAKHDSAGNVLWAFPIGNFQDDACLSVAVAASGNIYVTGYFQQIADFRGMSMSSYTLSSAGGKDIFLAKYNSMGQLFWARRAGGTGHDEGAGVCVNLNNIFVTGYFTGSASFGPLTTWTPGVNVNLFAACYDPGGNAQWVADGGTSQSANGRGITADATSVFVTGDFSGPTFTLYDGSGSNSVALGNTTPLSTDILVLRLQLNGQFAWANTISSPGNDYGRAIVQNGTKVFVGGSISAGADFPSWGSNPVAPAALGKEMFISALSKSFGVTQWVKAEQGFGNTDQEILSLSCGPAGAIYATGYYVDSLQISTGPLLDAIDSADVMVLRYDTSGIFDWSKSAGGNRNDYGYGISQSNYDEVYVGGEYHGSAQFDSYLLPLNNEANIFLGKIFCSAITNNVITTSQVVCINTVPAPITGGMPGGSSPPFTFLWEESPDNLIWSPAQGINTNQHYQPPSLSSSTFYRRIVTSSLPCSQIDTSSYILIQIDSLPTPAAAGADQNICSSSTLMSGNVPTSGTGTWVLYSGTGTIVTPTSPATSITGLGSGNNFFVWSITNGSCPSSTDTVVITRNIPPSTASAGNDQTLCATIQQLQGNIPVNGTGTWTVYAGSGTFVNPNLGTTAVNGLSAGLNTFIWTITNAPCAPSSDTVNLFVDTPPTTATAGPDQQICAYTDTLNGNTPVTGTGTWTVLSGPGVVTNPFNPQSVVTGLGVGVNAFIWTITNGVCPPSRDTIQILVNALPTTASAGTDQVICTSVTTLNGNVPVVGTGVWTLSSGNGNIVAPPAPNTSVTGMTPGVSVFVWTITNGVCPVSTDSVQITVDPYPSVANAGADQNVCNNTITLSGNIPVTGSGLWTLVTGSGSITTPTSAVTAVTSLGIGVNVFVWTISSGVCPPSTDTVIIVRDAMPSAANAGSDQTICSATTNLNAGVPTIGAGSWGLFSGTGNVLSPPNPATGITGMSPGQNIFIWTVTSGVCPSSTDTVVINVDAMPTPAFAGLDQTFCATQFNLQGNPPNSGTGLWTLITGSGNILNPSQNNSAVQNAGAGSNVFCWTITSGTCPPSADTVIITIFATPSPAVAGTDMNICTDSTQLNATAPITGTGFWSLVSGAGTFTNPFSAVTQVMNIGPGLNIYRWTITNGTCPPNTDDVNIFVDPFPDAADAGPDQIVHIPFAFMDATDPVTGTGRWEVESGSGQFSDVNNPNSSVTNLSAGVNIFRWIMSSGTCPEDTDKVMLRMDPLMIPEGFSPNGDQVNDHFEISGLLEFSEVKLTVFNRWGTEVYYSADYKNDWNGRNNGNSALAEDTYFFILEIPNTSPYKGYVILKR
ncbi:MAG: gliding motility-associated C-terminal domain-containing protein [Bacteroidia bacterium]|nr:gliding motility-associated C-terminal domain-containing protein [Bacteroidia bacterium]